MKVLKNLILFIVISFHCAANAVIEINLFHIESNSWLILNCGSDQYCIIYKYPNLWNCSLALQLTQQDNDYLHVEHPNGSLMYWVLPGQQHLLDQILQPPS